MVRVWGSLVDPKKKALINTPAPPGYIAGLGRGATGFTTRSDIGPALKSEDPLLSSTGGKDDGNENLNDADYDEFTGYGGSICKNDPYEADDVEADNVYASIDARMDERRKIRREKVERDTTEKLRKERPKIQQLFVELKRNLSSVSDDQWNAIPDVSDWKNRAKRNPGYDRYTPVPDSVISKVINDSSVSNAIDPNVQQGVSTPLIMNKGFQTPSASSGFSSNRNGDQTRNLLMDIKLSEVADSVTGQTVVDPK
ncbi:MAG: Pre-mRNA-processing factor 6, partial [Paramarteilia canceri]